MTWLKNLLDTRPDQISAALVAILNALVVLGVVTLTAEQIGAVNIALTALMAVFVASKTSNNAALNLLAPKATP